MPLTVVQLPSFLLRQPKHSLVTWQPNYSFFSAPPPHQLCAASPLLPDILMEDVGKTAWEVLAMKSAICRKAQMLEELFPFFICSWMRPSSSSLKD